MKRRFAEWRQAAMRIFSRQVLAPLGEAARMALRPGSLHWLQRYGLRMLGWPGMLGMAILAACPAFYFSAILPAQERLDAVRQSTLSLHDQIKLAADGGGGERGSPAQQLAEFYRIFPSDRNSPQWLKKIFSAAQSHGISLDQGEYEATRDQTGKLMRFQITLPVKGEYAQIRKFLAGLLSEVPIVSLEHVQFERQQVGDPEVAAKIKLALYLERSS